jgi:hypothetical protein
MKTRTFDRWVGVALAIGVVIFLLLLAGVGSGVLTNPTPYHP